LVINVFRTVLYINNNNISTRKNQIPVIKWVDFLFFLFYIEGESGEKYNMRGGKMKKAIFIFISIIVVVFLISTTSCKFIEDIFGGGDYGNYTSITFRVTVTYGGENSEGTHKLTIDNQVLHNHQFKFHVEDDCDDDICEDAVFEDALTFTVTINSATTTATQEYLNWKFWKIKPVGTSCKCLTTTYQANIVSYTYEDGKDDPGTPIIGGFDGLENWDFDSHCTGGDTNDCTISVTLTFTSPKATGAVQNGPVTAVQSKKECIEGYKEK
jgi:hypothetical protein